MHMLDLKKDKSKNAALVVEMAKRSGIGVWSARHDLANSGDPCPAIYGRNIVCGYSWGESDEIFVVSKTSLIHLRMAPVVTSITLPVLVIGKIIWSYIQ